MLAVKGLFGQPISVRTADFENLISSVIQKT